MYRWIIVGLVIEFGICASSAWLAHCSYLDARCNMGQLYHNGYVYTLTKVDMTAPQLRADNGDDCTIGTGALMWNRQWDNNNVFSGEGS